MSSVRTRFAPSPTGYLHIGGVRTALFNWLYARQNDGQFILRIDDTDQQRNVKAALQPILDGFRWLGIDWDEGPEVGGDRGPYFQSQRTDRYSQAVQQLLDNDAAYRDFARTEEIQAEREAAKAVNQSFTYSRRWMATTAEQAGEFEQQGREGVVRLKMPREGQCRFHDLIRGDLEFEWSKEQDHVIQRADGSALYHLATVVDDQDLAISHVIRAEEHLSNTPRQIFIAEGLGHPHPEFAHLPYVAEPGSKSKLSKRKIAKYLKNQEFKKLYEHGSKIAERIGRVADADTFNPVLVDFYRDVGYLADAVVNYLLLLGWSLDAETEMFSRQQMLDSFSLQRVVKAPASFDPAKLSAFQQRYMDAMPIKQKVAAAVPFLQRAGLAENPPSCDLGPRVRNVLEAAGDRIKVAGDILEFDEFFVGDELVSYDNAALEKRLGADGAADRLQKLAGVLAELTPEEFTPPRVEATIKSFVEEEAIELKQIIHAIRVAATGKPKGLGTFEALAILGRDSTLARFQRALQLVEA